MKQQSTTLVSSGFRTKIALVAAAVLMAVATPIAMMPRASADQYDDKINALKNQVNDLQAKAGELKQKANTLQSELNRLSAEKATIQTQIDLSQAKYEKLVLDIASNEKKIADNKLALGKIIADLYVGDKVSAIEMIASSNNIADYVDKQAQQLSVSDQLQVTIDTIRELKKQLEEQKVEVEHVLADQKSQREALAAKESESANLLAQTRGEEAAYQAMSAEKNAEISKLREQQAAYFISLRSSSNAGGVTAGDPNKGGYPAYLANAAQDSLVDPWGMYNRECVSYTAWKVNQKTGKMPYWGGRGHAWQWAFSGWKLADGRKASYNTGMWHNANSDQAGFSSGSAPQVGSVAVKDANPGAGDPYGHVAWVEQVSGSKIYISQYNYYNAGGSGWGHYSEMWVDSSTFQKYIYF